MTNEECYEIWAPRDAVWSPWAKPTLFAYLQRVATAGQATAGWETLDTGWAPEPRRGAAIVVELPGVEAVKAGLALARLGYRPVPLFNATVGANPVLNVEPLGDALLEGAEVLRGLALPPDAPPAFLLDARRLVPDVPLIPGKYDNRWIVLPQDLPSGTFLLARGLRDVLLAQRGEGEPRQDLAHVLLRWQQAGLRLQAVDVNAGGRRRDLAVRPPGLFRIAWYRLLALSGLRRNDSGGFGGEIPEPSRGTGYIGMG